MRSGMPPQARLHMCRIRTLGGIVMCGGHMMVGGGMEMVHRGEQQRHNQQRQQRQQRLRRHTQTYLQRLKHILEIRILHQGNPYPTGQASSQGYRTQYAHTPLRLIRSNTALRLTRHIRMGVRTLRAWELWGVRMEVGDTPTHTTLP